MRVMFFGTTERRSCASRRGRGGARRGRAADAAQISSRWTCMASVSAKGRRAPRRRRGLGRSRRTGRRYRSAGRGLARRVPRLAHCRTMPFFGRSGPRPYMRVRLSTAFLHAVLRAWLCEAWSLLGSGAVLYRSNGCVTLHAVGSGWPRTIMPHARGVAPARRDPPETRRLTPPKKKTVALPVSPPER